MLVYVVNNQADAGFSNFAIEYICEKYKVWETIFVCLNGAQVESFQPKNNCRKSRDTVFLTCERHQGAEKTRRKPLFTMFALTFSWGFSVGKMLILRTPHLFSLFGGGQSYNYSGI